MEILQDGKTAIFPEREIGAFVLPVIQGKAGQNQLNLNNQGIIGLSSRESQSVTGFRLGLIIPGEARLVVNQRNLGHTLERSYHNLALSVLKHEGLRTWLMMDHIAVRREKGVLWTVWAATVPNRVDLWFLTTEGVASMFQVGIIARDMGDNAHFRLLGELRGEWQLSRDRTGRVVGSPTNPIWGNFSARRPILEDPDFKNLLASATLPTNPENDAPKLNMPTGPNREVMSWWSPFAGKRGQGPIAPEGSYTWVCGEDVQTEPDADGIVRLPRGTIVSYEKIAPLGNNKKLLGVRRV